MSEIGKPMPIIDNDSKVFWEQSNNEKLMIPYCLNCNQYYFYPRIICPNCMSTNVEWKISSGRGEVYTFTIVRRAPMPVFKQDIPYAVAIIELSEGPRMMSNLINIPVDEIYCGMPVKVKFDHEKEGIRLPKFEPL